MTSQPFVSVSVGLASSLLSPIGLTSSGKRNTPGYPSCTLSKLLGVIIAEGVRDLGVNELTKKLYSPHCEGVKEWESRI